MRHWAYIKYLILFFHLSSQQKQQQQKNEKLHFSTCKVSVDFCLKHQYLFLIFGVCNLNISYSSAGGFSFQDPE